MVNASPLLTSSLSPRLADLAGRAIKISPAVPVGFYNALSPAQRRIGLCLPSDDLPPLTQLQASSWIDKQFDALIQPLLAPVRFLGYDISVRATACNFDNKDAAPKAACIISTNGVGFLDFRWIADPDAPVSWARIAYKAIRDHLPLVAPCHTYDDFMEAMACYHWGGELDDEKAKEEIQLYWNDNGEGEEIDFDDHLLPSQLEARRPDWMIIDKDHPLPERKALPPLLRQALINIKRTARTVRRSIHSEKSAWHFDHEEACQYVPEIDEAAHYPPLLLIPEEPFIAEADDLYRLGWEVGFMDVTGVMEITDKPDFDVFLASFKAGIDLLLAIQTLLDLDIGALAHAQNRD